MSHPERPLFAVSEVKGGQPYEPAMKRLMEEALTGWQPGDGHGHIILEHVGHAGENLVPDWARAEAEARASVHPAAPIRIVVRHDPRCALQIGLTGSCRCSSPAVSLVRSPRREP